MAEIASSEERLMLLTQKLSDLANEEKAAKAARIACEEELTSLSGFAKPSGSQSFSFAYGDNNAKVTFKQSVYAKTDQDMMSAVKKSLGPATFKKVFRQKFEVIAKGLKDLEKSDHDLYLAAVEAVTSTPGKVSVDIKSLEIRG